MLFIFHGLVFLQRAKQLPVALNASAALLTCNYVHAFSCYVCNMVMHGTHSLHMHTQPNLKTAFRTGL